MITNRIRLFFFQKRVWYLSLWQTISNYMVLYSSFLKRSSLNHIILKVHLIYLYNTYICKYVRKIRKSYTQLSGGYLWAMISGENWEIWFFTFHFFIVSNFHNQYLFYFINVFILWPFIEYTLYARYWDINTNMT